MQERHDCEPKARQSRVVLLNKYLEKFTILDCRAYARNDGSLIYFNGVYLELRHCEPKARQSRVVLLNKYLEKFTILDCRAYARNDGGGFCVVVLRSQ
jgi:tRNA isopentenyl-2-thiomethyl-A-37 hydroxylase MiaE